MSDDQPGAKPITLSVHAGPKGHALLAEVEAYWRSLRGPRRLPLRSDVDPSRIDGALPHAFVLERVAPGVARLRVAGLALSGHLGADARGMPLSAFFGAGARTRLRDLVDRVFDGPAIVELPVRASQGAFRQPLRGRLLLLPLLGSDDEPTRALGVLLLDGAAARGPRQFDIPEDGAVRCEPVEAIPALAYHVAAVNGGASLPPATAGAERPWLRLVVSNA